MTTKRLALVAGVFVGVMAFGWAYSRWSQNQRAQARQVNAELARLQAQVVQLASAHENAGTASVLRDAAAALRSATTSQALHADNLAGSSARVAPPEPTLTPEQLLERQNQYNAERLRVISKQLDDQLRIDGHDRGWSESMTAAATAVIESSISGRVQRVDCATRLCRIFVTHGSTEEQLQLGGRISGQPPFNEGDVLYQYDEGALTTTLYMSRVGTTLTSMLSDEM